MLDVGLPTDWSGCHQKGFRPYHAVAQENKAGQSDVDVPILLMFGTFLT